MKVFSLAGERPAREKLRSPCCKILICELCGMCPDNVIPDRHHT